METRVTTGCADCDAAPWPGVGVTWRPIGDDGPPWAARLQVRRCQACGRTWRCPWDPKDGTHYPDPEPLSPALDALLAPGAGVPEMIGFLEADRGDAAVEVGQAFLLQAAHDVPAAVKALVPWLPVAGVDPTFSILLLIEASLSGEAGRRLRLAQRTGGTGVRLDARAMDRLGAALDRVSEASGAGDARAMVTTSLSRAIAERVVRIG